MGGMRHEEDRLFLCLCFCHCLIVFPVTGRGLADPQWVSYESVNYPGRFIRHRSIELSLESGSGDLLKKDATFEIIDPRY